MKYLLFLVFAAGSLIFAQEGGEGGSNVTEPPPETPEQSATREVSLEELRNADTRIDQEREAVTKRAQRLEMLLEDLKNQANALDAKESKVMQALQDQLQNQQEPTIPDVQVAHWESRDPVVAAKDFVILYQEEPSVAVALIKKMKKKKSANLIDQVSLLSNNGKEIAAKLHEAIGTGRIETRGGGN